MVTVEQILKRLPPYRDEWVLVKRRQYVRHIMDEVLESHRLYGRLYDQFYDAFLTSDIGGLAEDLADFCRENIRYKEEPMARQTAGVPQGFLTRRSGDCKHYSLFIAGVIGAINRHTKLGIPCHFYFAGYGDAKEPHHVFVVVNDGIEDIWVDPTPGGGSVPSLILKSAI